MVKYLDSNSRLTRRPLTVAACGGSYPISNLIGSSTRHPAHAMNAPLRHMVTTDPLPPEAVVSLVSDTKTHPQ